MQSRIALSVAQPLAAALLALPLCAPPLWADPAPPQAAPGIEFLAYGIFCPPEVTGELVAPEAEGGIVSLFSDLPRIEKNGQEVPLVLGLGFGVNYVSDRDLGTVRFEAHRPNRPQPDIWHGEVLAGEAETQGFTFDTRDEMVAGLWRFEGWSGDTLLYAAEFEVFPAEALPGAAMICGLTS